MISTAAMMMFEFGKPVVRLEQIVEAGYLACKEKTANGLAASGELGFPAFKMGGGTTKWMVRVQDLADFIDSQAEKARLESQRVQSGKGV